ncbi:MAG: PaaI family thioesterase [Phycisphaerae bacterium]|nr:PaaI family thioesterase [Phycisphaerae bacterium]
MNRDAETGRYLPSDTKPGVAAPARTSAALRQAHASCFVCGSSNGDELGLSFHPKPDGSVVARFASEPRLGGYADRMHGGVISMILDDAMTSRLLQGQVITAVTGRLTVHYRHPVWLGEVIEVRARVKSSQPPLFRMEAELTQDRRVCRRATAKFAHVDMSAPVDA